MKLFKSKNYIKTEDSIIVLNDCLSKIEKIKSKISNNNQLDIKINERKIYSEETIKWMSSFKAKDFS